MLSRTCGVAGRGVTGCGIAGVCRCCTLCRRCVLARVEHVVLLRSLSSVHLNTWPKRKTVAVAAAALSLIHI